MPPQLRAATARAVITPPVGITHAHWGAQTHTRAEGVDLDLWATVLVLADDETQVAIVDADVIGIPDEIVAKIREATTQLTGIPASHLRLSASHTHSGGNLSPGWFPEGQEMIPAHAASFVDRIVGAIWEAQRNLRPARIAAGIGQSNVAVNRRYWHPDQKRIVLGRNWEGFADHDMPVARIDDEHEQVIATVVCYQCHPTIMAHLNSRITPDFPGVLRRTVEREVGGRCLFLQGATGDLHPKQSFSSRREDYHRVGTLLGLEAAKVALGLETLPKVERLVEVLESGAELGLYVDEPGPEPDGTVRVATRTIELPLRELPSLEEAEADHQRNVEALAEARRSGDDAAIRRHSMLAKRSRMRLGQSRAYQGRSTATVELQAFRVGSLALLCMPGEPFNRIGVEIRRQSPFPVTMFSGYSNGQFSYIPLKADYELDGYGVWNSPLGPGAGERVIEESVSLLKELV